MSALGDHLPLAVVLDRERARDPDQRLLPDELVDLAAAVNREQPDFSLRVAEPGGTVTYDVAIAAPAVKVTVTDHTGSKVEVATAAYLVPLALATWLDLGDRGPAPADAQVVATGATAPEAAGPNAGHERTVTITRPNGATTTIVPTLPTGYRVGTAIEGRDEMLMTPATGHDVWLVLCALCAG
jgi:hypothetical protein